MTDTDERRAARALLNAASKNIAIIAVMDGATGFVILAKHQLRSDLGGTHGWQLLGGPILIDPEHPTESEDVQAENAAKHLVKKATGLTVQIARVERVQQSNGKVIYTYVGLADFAEFGTEKGKARTYLQIFNPENVAGHILPPATPTVFLRGDAISEDTLTGTHARRQKAGELFYITHNCNLLIFVMK